MNGEKNKILIVDDDDIIRDTYVQVFRNRGFEATGAKDGIEGADLATKERFDVIMTGIIMPRMDGFKLISTLRENIETKDIPIVIISHLGREEDRKKAIENGVANFIVQGAMSPREVVDKVMDLVAVSPSYLISFDTSGWDAPALSKKLDLASFECPNCQNKLILELVPDSVGKTLKASFKCPKCEMKL